MQVQGVRPRDEYGPRRLLPETYGRRAEYRAFDKKKDDPRGDEALPAEWAVVCPNRICERRKAAGYPTTMQLARAMATISYQRLKKMEHGRVIVRESEFELVAAHLGVPVEDLKLPLLTASETSEWNRIWGPSKLIEEGGDHDSVLLSAYVRKLVDDSGETPKQGRCGDGIQHQRTVLHLACGEADRPISRFNHADRHSAVGSGELGRRDHVIAAPL